MRNWKSPFGLSAPSPKAAGKKITIDFTDAIRHLSLCSIRSPALSVSGNIWNPALVHKHTAILMSIRGGMALRGKGAAVSVMLPREGAGNGRSPGPAVFLFPVGSQKLMWMRIQYMMEQGFLPDKPVLLGYEQVEEQAALLKEMALKYNISLDCGLKSRSISFRRWKRIFKIWPTGEERILEEVLRAMRQPRNTH